MAPTPGILYVTMQPNAVLPTAQFHDWYNNEHGPGRLRLGPSICLNGFRYRATDLSDQNGKGTEEKPEWMAIYDIPDMAEMTKEPYTLLRKAPAQSQRERDTMKGIKVDRRFYDYVGGRESQRFKKLEEVNAEGEGNVLVSVSIRVQPGKGEELDRWYNDEHIDMLSKVPGWLRTRRFVTASIEGKEEVEYMALHEYAPENGLGGEDFQAAISTNWADEVNEKVMREKKRRVYDLYYTFGPVPRDLESLTSPDTKNAESTNGMTRTMPSTRGGAIESYVTTGDGVVLPYRLEGSTDVRAPLIVLSNSILVGWGIWDGFVDAFFAKKENRKYRVVRYLTRGRSGKCGEKAVTVYVLASDIIALLDALRVPKAAAVIGVSLGGATVLNTALKYPERVAAFVSCDTSAKSPEGNKKTWSDRIVVAEKEGAKAQSGESIVGEDLAELTVRRWFVRESYDGGAMEAKIGTVKEMVKTNSLDGFKKSVEALFQYDLREAMKESEVKGAFVVGSGDGVLPGAMKEMSKGFGKGAECVVIDGAGHLPMVEKPQEFADIVTKFLG